MLQSALIGQEVPIIDCHSELMPLDVGDLILIASDGVLTLSEHAITALMHEKAAQGAQVVTQALLRAVEELDKPHQDNCTAIVASVPHPRAAAHQLPTSLLALAALTSITGMI
jgi:hypothetical protein